MINMIEMLKSSLPEDLQVVFISSVTGYGINELKDILWAELNSESNKIQGVIAEDTLVHRDKDLTYLAEEVYDEDRDADAEIGIVEEIDEEDVEYIDENEIDDLEDFEYV